MESHAACGDVDQQSDGDQKSNDEPSRPMQAAGDGRAVRNSRVHRNDLCLTAAFYLHSGFATKRFGCSVLNWHLPSLGAQEPESRQNLPKRPVDMIWPMF